MSHEQRRAIDAQLRAGRPDPSSPTPTLEDQRAGFAALMQTMQVPQVRTKESSLADRRCLEVFPLGGAARPGILLYLHGGSFALGTPESAMSLTAALVERTQLAATSLDYRLAPEHPFPAGLHDAAAAYRELLNEHDPASIVIAGDSAGGALAIGAVLQAREAGLPLPACVVGFSPGIDHARQVSDELAASDPIFSREALAASSERYLAGADRLDSLASPARTADLSGLPPTLLQVGSNDIIHADSVLYAERARRAGGDVILDVTGGVPHVFQTYAGRLDEADQALDRAALFITQHLA